ncbi:MAG: hypothetical protein ACI9MR_002115 [Myxococcota bacterium]|jgi:hypothetical protein
MMRRWLLLGASALVFVACGDDDDAQSDTTTTDTTVADTTETDTVEDDTSVEDTIETDSTDSDTVSPPECTSACDCEQGSGCVEGACVLGATSVFCCTNDGCTADAACTNTDGSAGLCGVETSSVFGQVIINEILTDGETDGDANGDGDLGDAVGDEFVEFVNTGNSAVDMSGFTLVESDLSDFPRHTFAAGAMLTAGQAYVIFGGGTAPEDTATATFAVANAEDPGTPFGLALDNTDDALRLLDADGKLVAVFAYGTGAAISALSDQSYTRDPDLTGDFVPHADATGDATQIFSPGTRADGTSF